jgi:putative transposase
VPGLSVYHPLMARPLRIEYPGALYHVTSRGNGRGKIFRSPRDRVYFLELLSSVVLRFHWLCHGFCLMDNHYHLLIETPEANLSRGMRHLNGVYTQAWNWKYQRPGHVFQGRFKAIIVEKDEYLLELSRYIVLNPVRAHMVLSAEEWKWSSYHPLAGLSEAPAWFTTDWVLAQFSPDEERAHEGYRNFVRRGITKESIWGQLTGQVFLGGKDFIERAKSVHPGKGLGEIPRTQRYASRPGLTELFADLPDSKAGRNEIVRQAHLDHGYSLKEIAAVVGLHYTTVSKIVNRK